ncbi:Sdf2 [Symbiodinium microadriaticum]|nr:Sdf2 [Symbiodinium microadriaticum]
MSNMIFTIVSVVLSSLLCLISAEDQVVSCGSAVKLLNVQSNHHLHSHGIAYGSGSGQQSVTAHGSVDDQGSLWLLTEGEGSPLCEAGTPIKCGSRIRLRHMSTGKNLHSHMFKSPLSGNFEVSGFGENGHGDTGDNWEVQCRKGPYWLRGEHVQLKHVDTGKYLFTSPKHRFSVQNCGQQCPIMDQQEVCTISKSNDANTYWKTTQGVYFPKTVGKNDEL